MTDQTLRKLWKFAAVGSASLTALLLVACAFATHFYGRLPLWVPVSVVGTNVVTAFLCAVHARANGSPGSRRLARTSYMTAGIMLAIMIIRLA